MLTWCPQLLKKLKYGGGKKKKAYRTCIDWLLGVSMAERLNSSYLVKIWRTGGFIVNTNMQEGKQYYSQSGHGTCVFGKRETLQAMHFDEEIWLQDTRYALPDDMVMFYKLHLMGARIAVNRSVRFVHLDAGSSLASEEKKLANMYASARNGFVFWHRFIYKCQDKKWLSVACVLRRMFFTLFFAFLKSLAKWNWRYVSTYAKAYADAFRFVRSERYKELPAIRLA